MRTGWNRIGKRFRKSGAERYTWTLHAINGKSEYLTIIGSEAAVKEYCESNGWWAGAQYDLCDADLNNKFAQERGWMIVL
jgi:hypothetical protein